MFTVAMRVPPALGSKVTVKVVRPLGLIIAGRRMPLTVKSLEFVPLSVMLVTFAAAMPVFSIAKMRSTVPPLTDTLPKSVPCATSGKPLPLEIELPLPFTWISDAQSSYEPMSTVVVPSPLPSSFRENPVPR